VVLVAGLFTINAGKELWKIIIKELKCDILRKNNILSIFGKA